MLFECLQAVLRACRSEATGCRLERGDADLVKADEPDERKGEDALYGVLDAHGVRRCPALMPLFHWLSPSSR